MAQPLRTLLGAKGWLRDFLGRRLLRWSDHWLTCSEAPWEHYAALDLLVMPSRFEGQPLAMQYRWVGRLLAAELAVSPWDYSRTAAKNGGAASGY